MNLLYFSYWGINEGLTNSTIIPYLEYLSSKGKIDKIIFCTVERDSSPINKLTIDKVEHHPIFSKNIRPYILSKIVDSFIIKKRLLFLADSHRIDKVYCKASLAGVYGNHLFKKRKIDYIVDSFEPHADYMAEANVWKKYRLRYSYQKTGELNQKKNAEFIIPISIKYKNVLIKEGVPEKKLRLIPACVDFNSFKFCLKTRNIYREKLKVSNSTVAIYVGKFGDIYYDEEAFIIFKKLFNYFENLYLIILTPNSKSDIKLKLIKHKIDPKKTFLNQVPHHKVVNYLNAADFAISIIRPTYFRQFCSAVKHGEYWANGLPLFLSYGIGDDSEIVEKHSGGVVFNLETNLSERIILFKLSLSNFKRKNISNISTGIAKKYRNFTDAFKVIDEVLKL